MKRVVVTGMGIVSSIGSDKAEVLESLRQGRSGISYCEEYKDLGFRCHVHGKPKVDLAEAIDRRVRRFMGDGAAFHEPVKKGGILRQDVGDVYGTVRRGQEQGEKLLVIGKDVHQDVS